MNDDRVLPCSLDAERSVLGGILLDNHRLADACQHITPAAFFRAAHRTIFARMLALHEDQEAIDFLTLKEALAVAGELDAVGGPAYLASLTDGVPHSTNVVQYAQIVGEKAALRALIQGANALLSRAYGATDDAQTILEEAERAIIGLADRATTTGFEPMRTIAGRGLDVIERAHRTRRIVSGVPTGFTILDELTRGLQPGTLVTVGARPGIGKTSLATNIAQHAAEQGYVTGMFSLEMGKEELFMREVAAVARMDSQRLQSGYIGEHEWGRISQAIGTIAESPLHLDDTPSIGLFEVRSRARRLKVEHGLQLLIIDYLQLMATPGDGQESRAIRLGVITAGLKALSKELQIPILLLSQLNREQEKRGGRPRLADLRDSGSIEQDSDIVLLLHRPEQPDRGDEQGVTEVIIAKHRNGPIGSVKLQWFEQQTRFENLQTYDAPADRRLPMSDQ